MLLTRLVMQAFYWIGAVVVDIAQCVGLLHRLVWRQGPREPRWLRGGTRAIGIAMLVVSQALCVSRWGWDLGLLIWLGLLLACTLTVALLWPRIARRGWGMGPAVLMLVMAALIRGLG